MYKDIILKNDIVQMARGGVALYVKDSTNYISRTDLESETLIENIVIEIVFSTNFVTTLYKPHSRDQNIFKVILTKCSMNH